MSQKKRQPHAYPIQPKGEPLAEALLGLAGLILLFILLFMILPIIAQGVVIQ